MSGGSGRRFWPLSRRARPKQLVKLIDGRSPLELTIERLLPIFEPEAIWVVTQAPQIDATRRIVSEYGNLKVLSEPVGKNTAPCIGYAATLALATVGDASLVFLPADHLVRDEEKLRNLITAGLDFVEKRGTLLTLGIKPDRPATGFGYIRAGERLEGINGFDFFKATRFVEKPSLRVAREYVSSGEYLWNSGIFLFKTSIILDEMEKHLPEMRREFRAFEACVGGPDEESQKARCYSNIGAISIDFGVMEKTERACVAPAVIGWDDVGSWDSFAKYLPKDGTGNSVRGEHVGIDSKNCVIYAEGRFVATIGVDDIVLVVTDDAILLARRDEAERVKELANLMEEQGFGNLL
jgi:mannose-1-phosphate guanylyltransferase